MSEDKTINSEKLTFKFFRELSADTEKLEWPAGADVVRKALGEALNAKHVAFLLGAGCSSYCIKGDGKESLQECGIPTMGPLAEEFTRIRTPDEQDFLTTGEHELFKTAFGIDICKEEYSCNLERLMELLFSLRFFLERSSLADTEDKLTTVNSIIRKVQAFLWKKCTDGCFAHGDNSVLELYKAFYRKLILRDRSLPRPWIFTTNYDLFNETAMDGLGLPYANGFSGVVERRFNPATFRYALAEQLDLTSHKWSAVEGFVYLCKLHGSVSWIEDNHGLFPIREMVVSKEQEPGKVMIYPTPAKQNSSLGSPYSDLFREFQARIVREQSVLFTMGYGFGDEHINNIIYQALTIPTFRLVIFADPESEGDIKKLRQLDDPRIWIIGGDGPEKDHKAHYFNTIIKEFMPQQPSERIDDAIEKILTVISQKKNNSAETGENEA